MLKINVKKLEHNIESAASLLKALANEHRLKIVCVLYYGEKNVTDLSIITGLSQSALSQHLARLRREGIVETRRDAQTIFYTLNRAIRSEVLHSLYEFHDMDGAVSA